MGGCGVGGAAAVGADGVSGLTNESGFVNGVAPGGPALALSPVASGDTVARFDMHGSVGGGG